MNRRSLPIFTISLIALMAACAPPEGSSPEEELAGGVTDDFGELKPSAGGGSKGKPKPDAGTTVDAGTPKPDAGTSVDGGTGTDAGTPTDGGTTPPPDGGTTPPPDGGTTTAAGVIPAGLPRSLSVGLFENTSETWMRNSGVPWQMRYRYFVKGWVNNWGWGAYDGSWGLQYMRDCDNQGYIPAIEYYQVNGEPGGGEAQFLTKVQTVSTMTSYFNDFKILLQRAKEFGKPVLVLMEADGYAYLEHYSNDNPNAYAAVAATGIPELAGLPNTVAGWGLAFLQLRNALGASNVILGIHVSGWASRKDIVFFSVTDPLQPEVDKVYNFLAPLGLGPNQTGSTYDVLVGDPLDRDSDYYRLQFGQDRWLDMSDSASISSKSYNRYAEWLRLWNLKSSKRWVLWQIPLGNQWHRNVYNDGTARAGYKSNHTEYFFGPNANAHLQKFAANGVIALLFGLGLDGQSSYQNDLDSTGQPYLKTQVGTFFRNGGLPLQ